MRAFVGKLDNGQYPIYFSGQETATDLAHELFHIKQFTIDRKHYLNLYSKVGNDSSVMHSVLEYHAWKGLVPYQDSFGLDARYIRNQWKGYRDDLISNKVYENVK